MPRSTALAIAAALLMVIAAAAVRAAWDGDGGEGARTVAATSTTAGEPTATTAAPPTTEGGEVTFTAPTEPTTSAPPTTAPPPPVGSMGGLPFPGAGSITVGAGSTYETSFTVSARSPDEVVEWLVEGLEADGWDVAGVGPADGAWATVRFHGPGARGDATVTDLDGDEVGVRVRLDPPTA